MNLTSAQLTQKGAVLSFDDGSTQEFDYAPVSTEPTQTVTITAGQTVEVIAQ